MSKNKLKVLVVEDDPNLGTLLTEFMNAKGFNAHLKVDGQQGFEAFSKGQYDFCILDVMMPKKDGFTLAKEIRKLDKEIPIIFLTAKDMKDDRIEGLTIGADDYITKPFSVEELLLRMKGILKRMGKGDEKKPEKHKFKIGKFKFNYNERELTLGEHTQRISPKESDLLRLLCMNKNDVLDRSTALKAVWGDDSYFNARSMDVFITRLRKHLKDDPKVEIRNEPGKGFKLMLN